MNEAEKATNKLAARIFKDAQIKIIINKESSNEMIEKAISRLREIVEIEERIMKG